MDKLKQVNFQLKSKSIWIIIGYSFNDPIIQEIFVRNSDKNKKIVLLHPQAQEVNEKRLKNVKSEKISLLNQKFGESNFRDVNYALVNQLTPTLEYGPTADV